ncbi:hypothetical protein ACFLR7_04040 [Acidobacteriota bacterium]
MKKWNVLGILGFITVALFLAAIIMQAQVQTLVKPDSPPGLDKKEPEEEATWAVSIPTLGDTMLFGDGYDYIDGEHNIEVTVEKNSPGAWRRDNDFVTYIGFKILNPTTRYVDFEDVLLSKLQEGDYPYIDPDYGKSCSVFPPPYDGCQDFCDTCDPFCMQDFMNGVFHPYTNGEESTYRYFLIELHAFDKDILTMDPGESYLLGTDGHLHDYIMMTLRYQTEGREPTYHNIECRKSAHLGEASIHPFNIWISRTGEDTWRIDVGTIALPQFLFLEEYYYETIQRGKKTTIDGWYSTLFAGGDFYFSFELIRIPPSNQ